MFKRGRYKLRAMVGGRESSPTQCRAFVSRVKYGHTNPSWNSATKGSWLSYRKIINKSPEIHKKIAYMSPNIDVDSLLCFLGVWELESILDLLLLQEAMLSGPLLSKNGSHMWCMTWATWWRAWHRLRVRQDHDRHWQRWTGSRSNRHQSWINGYRTWSRRWQWEWHLRVGRVHILRYGRCGVGDFVSSWFTTTSKFYTERSG